MSQEFDSNVLNLVKQKGFYPYEYISHFKKGQEKPPGKRNFYSSLTDKKFSDQNYENAVKVLNAFEMKTMKDYHDFTISFMFYY